MSHVLRLLTAVFSRLWGLLALLSAWQLWVMTTTPNTLIVVPPLAVLQDLTAEPALYLGAALWTLFIAVTGLLCGMTLGLLLAVLAWMAPLFSGMLSPAALLLSATPVVCIIPLLARIFGYHAPTELATVSIMLFFPSFVFASAGLRALPAMSAELLDTWNTSPGRHLRYLALPAAVPAMATALRSGAAASVLVAVVAEYLMQTGGLGALFAFTMQQFDIPRAFGASLCAMFLSATLYSLAAWVERRFSYGFR